MITSSSATKRMSSWFALVAFVVVSLLVIQVFRAPPVLADALDYFTTAHLLPDVTATHRHLRIGLVWPLWALIESFGYTELAYYAIPWFSCFLLGFATWCLGKALFSDRVGWVGALVIMLLPPYAAHVSMLLPDYLSAGLFTLGVATVCIASQPAPGRLQSSPWLFLAAGLLVGWSYLVREFVALFFPCLGLAMLLLRVPLRAWLAFALGALAAYALEPLWGWLVHSDPLVRLTTAGAPRDTRLSLSMDVVDVLTQFPTRFTNRSGGWLLAGFMVFGLVASAVGAFRRRPGWPVLAAWALPGWIFFTIIALLPILLLGEGATYLRMHLFRYWAMILPPVVLAGAAGIFAIHDWLRARGWGRTPASAVLLALLAVPFLGVGQGLQQLASHPDLVRNSPDYQEFRAYVASGALPQEIWMDSATTVSADKSLPMYFRSWTGGTTHWDGTIRPLNSSRNEWLPRREIKGGHVVLDRSRSERIFSRATPDYFRAPETVWHTVFRSSSGRILVLDPSRPAPLAEATVDVDPATLQVRVANGDGVTHAQVENGLQVRVGAASRAVLVDEVAPGVRAPPAGRNLLPRGRVERMTGNVVYVPGEGGEVSLTIRCLFYDETGKRKSPWATLPEPLPEPPGRIRQVFYCDIPEGFDTRSARLLLQLSSGTDLVLEEIDYGFTAVTR